MANVYDVANFFIGIANKSADDSITNLKLNKLLYFAQGVFWRETVKFCSKIRSLHGNLVPLSPQSIVNTVLVANTP